MSSEPISSSLRAHETQLRELGVDSLFLFGSVARGDQQPDSDVDLFFDHSRALSLLDVMAVRDTLQAALGRRADVMTRKSLHPYLRERIERDAKQIF